MRKKTLRSCGVVGRTSICPLGRFRSRLSDKDESFHFLFLVPTLHSPQNRWRQLISKRQRRKNSPAKITESKLVGKSIWDEFCGSTRPAQLVTNFPLLKGRLNKRRPEKSRPETHFPSSCFRDGRKGEKSESLGETSLWPTSMKLGKNSSFGLISWGKPPTQLAIHSS